MKLLRNLLRRIGNVENRLQKSNEYFDLYDKSQQEINMLLANKIKQVENKLEEYNQTNTTLLDGCVRLSDDIVWCAVMNDMLKDYFTQEPISQDAKTTKTLYVVNWWNVNTYYFKDSEFSKDQDIKEISWNLYLFI